MGGREGGGFTSKVESKKVSCGVCCMHGLADGVALLRAGCRVPAVAVVPELLVVGQGDLGMNRSCNM